MRFDVLDFLSILAHRCSAKLYIHIVIWLPVCAVHMDSSVKHENKVMSRISVVDGISETAVKNTHFFSVILRVLYARFLDLTLAS